MSIILDGTNGITSVTGSAALCAAGPAFSAYMSSNQSISNATGTLMQFNTKFFDTAGCFNNTGSTVTLNGISVPAYSFAPNVAGYYNVIGNLAGPSSLTGYTATFFGKNSTTVGNQYLASIPNQSNGSQAVGSSLIYLNGTSDYINIIGFQTTGGSATIYSGTNGSIFSVYLVRGA